MQQTPSIVQIVEDYNHQIKKDAAKSDRKQLEHGKKCLYEELDQTSWRSEIVHKGHELLFLLGDKEAIIDLLQRYLSRPLPIPEESWARWNLTDNFAMLRQYENTVQSQKKLLLWTQKILPQPNWLLPYPWPLDMALHSTRSSRSETPADEGLLFRMMYDGTQARSWIELGKSDEWLHIYHELMNQIPHTPRNLVERRYYIRTAAMVMNLSDKPSKALQEAKKLDELAQQNPEWPEAFETQIDARHVELEAYHTLNDMPNLRRAAQSVTSRLEEEYCIRETLSQEAFETLRRVYHNCAAPIYRAKQYDLAIPLFKRAVEMDHPAEHPYLWLAASIWATTKDRSEVLSILKKGVYFSRFGKYSNKVKEFEDLKDDPEFQAALKRPEHISQ